MPTPPTFVQEDEVADWTSTTTPRNLPAFSPAAGNLLLAFLAAENTDGVTNDILIANGPTWSNVRDQPGTSNSDCDTRVMSATAAGGSITPAISNTIAQGTPDQFGANVLEFSNHGGLGANAGTTNGLTTTHVTLAITTQAANSAIAVIFADFAASAVPNPATAYDQVNGQNPTVQTGQQSSGRYTTLVAWYADAGAAGSKTVGVTFATAPDCMIVAVEIKAAPASAVLFPKHRFIGPQRKVPDFRPSRRPFILDTQAAPITLVVADIAQARTAENVALTQVHALSVADIAQARSMGNVALTQVHVLTVANIAQARTMDNVVLEVGGVTLTVANIAQSRSMDNVALTQAHVLTVADIAQARTMGNVVLTQVHVLTVANVAQARTMGNVVLTQLHILTVANVAQARSMENVVLSTSTILTVANIAQARSTGNVALTQVHVLTVANVGQARTMGAPTLTQLHQLIVQALLRAQTLGSPVLVHNTGLEAPAERRMYVAPRVDVVITGERRMYVARQVRRLIAPKTPDVLVYDFRELTVRR